MLTRRQAKLVMRNPAVSFGRIMQFLVLASLYGSIYYKLPLDEFVTKISLSIFAASAVAFAAFAEIPALFVGKRTAARQMEGGFYGPLSYVISVFVNSLPISFISTFLFATILYWMTGFANDVGRYFFFCLALMSMELACASLFRFYSFIWPTEELTQAAAGITTGSLLVFGGFYIAYPLIPKYMWPIYYFSTFSWTVRSIVLSEFTSSGYQVSVCGTGMPMAEPPPFDLQAGNPCLLLKGDAYLDAFGFFKGIDWQWGGIAYCLAFCFTFGIVFSAVAVKYMRARQPPGSQRISEDRFIAAATASADKMKEREGAVSSSATAARVSSQVLPFTPVTLSFEDITYSVELPKKGGTKQLLRGISGVAKPGSLTALMGASGAGKTTLRDVLAFRKTTGTIGGKTQINGNTVTAAEFSRLAGFAEQEDIHFEFCTVRETVAFSAALRLPSTLSKLERDTFVNETLLLLELTPLADRATGSLAQGECKRLTIAVEMAGNPAVLFLDEPTTGLDARAASVVMRVIRNVATTGRTVIATIHQPSAEIFFAFDSLICLVPGGYEAYVGPLGFQAKDLTAFLQSIDGVRPLPTGVNPATWMLEEMGSGPSAAPNAAGHTASPDVEAPSVQSAASSVMAAYAASTLYKSNKAEFSALESARSELPKPLARPMFLIIMGHLLARVAKFTWRNTALNSVRLFVFIFLAIFFGLLYYKVDASTYSGAFSKLAVALNGLLFLSIINLNTNIPNYFRLRKVFYRERASGMYPSIAYPLSIIIIEIPWSAFFSLLFTAINYNMVGFKAEADPFFTAYLATFLSAFWFYSIGLGFIAFFPVQLLANIAGGVTIQISILFAGVNLSRPQLPQGWRWLYDADGFAHALRLFFLPQFDGDNTRLQDPNPTLNMTRQEFSRQRLDVDPSHRWDDLGILIGILMGAVVLMILFTVKINHQKK
jgi:ABC-type multidrug transport system ATPase subunit/ABC-type multidrug transport system permease subunit